jgi:hypothetical protein
MLTPSQFDSAMRLGVAVVLMVGLSIFCTVGLGLVRAGTTLLQPDWRVVTRRIESSLMALRYKR